MGIRYEERVSEELVRLYGDRCELQKRVPSGIIDAYLKPCPLSLAVRDGDGDANLPEWAVIVEIKNTLSIQAYDQLQRYAGAMSRPVAKVIIAKTCGPVAFPEPPIYLRDLPSLAMLSPGFYILPLQLKRKRK